jgi:GTP-binding protein
MDVVRADFLTSAASCADFPRDGIPEIAFVGRSNVGKSSLLNKLASRRALAHTSATPGKTRLVNFFRIERKAAAPLLFVDLPGYGWARVARRERSAWRHLIESYLEGRAALRAVLLLLDARRDPADDERNFLPWLQQRGVPVRLVVTKIDKLRASEREARLRSITRELGIPRAALLPTSARTGAGIDELWREIDALVTPPAAASAVAP